MPPFPLMIYCVTGPEEMRECAEMGFNTTWYGPLAEEERHGLYMVARGDQTLPERFWIANFIMDKPDFYTNLADGTLKYPPEWVQEQHEKAKREYPDVPTIVFLSGLVSDDLTRQFLETDVDIIALDWCRRNSQRPISLLPPLMRRFRELGLGSRPLWVILQVGASNMEAASSWENRALTHMALVHGAGGLGWWAYRYATHYDDTGTATAVLVKDAHPALWASIRRSCAEVNQMQSALAATAYVPPSIAGTVAYREICDDRYHWLLAVEEHGVAQFPTMTLHVPLGAPAEYEVRVLTEARNVKVCKGTHGLEIQDGFIPYEAHAYCLRMKQAGEGSSTVPSAVPGLGKGGYF